MNKFNVKFYGVRGSMAQAHRDFMEYGGNTSSVVVRTPEGSLIFLDAGTGIQYAAREELQNVAERIYLGLSHTHADHTQGLGMSPLPWLSFNPKYSGKQAQLMGPVGVVENLQQFYDGKHLDGSDNKCWPVRATDDQDYKNPKMPGITFGHAGKPWELKDGDVRQIDDSTNLRAMKGNHPVASSSIFYRLESGGESFVYATDNEFDFLNGPVKNESAEELKEAYRKFIRRADVLVADSQYTKAEYESEKPNVKGFGHAYIEQVIELANEAGVRKVVPFHHHVIHTDKIMAELESAAKELAKKSGYEVEIAFAREGMIL